MSGGIPVTLTNSGTAITATSAGIPVTLTGGTAAAVSDGDVVQMDVDGSTKNVTFTVSNGAITAITTAAP